MGLLIMLKLAKAREREALQQQVKEKELRLRNKELREELAAETLQGEGRYVRLGRHGIGTTALEK